MDKLHCEVVRDLLPLVVDDVASGESKKLVGEHMETCETCRAYYEGMTLQIGKMVPGADTETSFIKFCRRMEKQISARKLLRTMMILIVAAALLLGGFVLYESKTIVDREIMPIEWMNAELRRDVNGDISIRIDPEDGKRWYSSVWVEYDNGIYYIIPTMPEWRLWYLGTTATTNMPMYDDLLWENGALYYVVREYDTVYDEEMKAYRDEFTVHKREIDAIRWGDRSNFTTLYVPGDEIPLQSGMIDTEVPLPENLETTPNPEA